MLHSAEAIKYTVKILSKYMEKTEYSSKGRVILATVTNDIHDINKKLVDIILTSNGFEVHNMGVKVPVKL